MTTNTKRRKGEEGHAYVARTCNDLRLKELEIIKNEAPWMAYPNVNYANSFRSVRDLASAIFKRFKPAEMVFAYPYVMHSNSTILLEHYVHEILRRVSLAYKIPFNAFELLPFRSDWGEQFEAYTAEVKNPRKDRIDFLFRRQLCNTWIEEEDHLKLTQFRNQGVGSSGFKKHLTIDECFDAEDSTPLVRRF